MSNYSREDVLDAFAVEATLNIETLAVYCKNYPELASDLNYLWMELSIPHTEYYGPMSDHDKKQIKFAWNQYLKANIPSRYLCLFLSFSIFISNAT